MEPGRPPRALDRFDHGRALGERLDRFACDDGSGPREPAELRGPIDQVLPDRVLIRALGHLRGVDPDARLRTARRGVEGRPRAGRCGVLTRREQGHQRRGCLRDPLEHGAQRLEQRADLAQDLVRRPSFDRGRDGREHRRARHALVDERRAAERAEGGLGLRVPPARGTRRGPRRGLVDPCAGVRGPDVATHPGSLPG